MPKRPIYAAHRAARKGLRPGWYFDTWYHDPFGNALSPRNPQRHGPYADGVEAHYALAKLLPGKDQMNYEINDLVLKHNWGVQDARMEVASRNIKYALGNPNVKIRFSKLRHEPRENPKHPIHSSHKAAASRHPLVPPDFKTRGETCDFPLKKWDMEITKRAHRGSPHAGYPQVSRCFSTRSYASAEQFINSLGYDDFREFGRDFMITEVNKESFPWWIEPEYHPITDFFEMEKISDLEVRGGEKGGGRSPGYNIKYSFVKDYMNEDWDSDRFLEEWEDRHLGPSFNFEEPTADDESYTELDGQIFKVYDSDDFDWYKRDDEDDEDDDEEDDDDLPY